MNFLKTRITFFFLAAMFWLSNNALSQTCTDPSVYVASGQTCGSGATLTSNPSSVQVSNGGEITNVAGVQAVNIQSGALASIVNGGVILGGPNVGSLNNGGDGIYNGTSSTISSINNTGSISGGSANGASSVGGYGVDVWGNLGGINNSGAISGGNAYSSSGYSQGGNGLFLDGIATTASISNVGSIAAGNASGATYSVGGNAIYIASQHVTSLTNSGSIIGGNANGGSISNQAGSAIYNTGTIGTLTNTGSISAGVASGTGVVLGYGIDNPGSIYGGTYFGTLNNAQGGNGSSPSTTALTLSGTVPTNYNIIITNATHYGQLVAYYSNGLTFNFGISALSATGSGVLGTYSTVLNGVTSSMLGYGSATTSGTQTSNGYTYTLNETGSATNIWDLILTAAPSPSTPSYTPNVLANNNPAAVGAANSLTTAANNSTPGLGGVITTLNGLSGAAQSNAISQTLPTVVGSSSLAAASSQRSFNQIIQARQNVQVGLSSGEDFIASGDVWLKGFGGWANQNDQGGVSGYKVTGSGLAIGADHALSPRSNIGAVFAFGNSSVTGNNTAAPSDVTVASYQAGVYGDYAIDPVLNWNYQADAGFNNNQESRNLAAFAGTTGVTGTTASASYNSVSEHIGTGLRYLMPLTDSTNFLPALRVDYTSIQSKAYTENGAGSLNLNVNSQTYNELLLGADLRVDQELVHTLKLSANVGVGYNTLNNQVQITSSYMGGGSSFVTNGLAVSPWLYNAGLGLSGKLEKNMELAVRYDVQATTTGYTNQMASAKLKVFF